MSFIHGKPFTITGEQLKSFTRQRKRFHCSLCNHDFKESETARFVYANSTPGCGGNFFVCSECDTPDHSNALVLEKAKDSYTWAVRLAKQWGIYGPDWQQDERSSWEKERTNS